MKKLTGSRMANLVVIAAVLIVPLLYAGLLTLAYQNPTNLLERINAAVVNEDTAYTATLASGKTETLALGDELADALVHPDADTDTGFTWHRMSAEDARKKMRTEEIRAILYIPEGFSERASAVGSADPSTAATQTLELVTDDGVNYLTGTMARTVAETLANRLEAQGSEKILSTLLLSVSEIRDGMTSAADGARSLSAGSATLAEGTTSAAEGADSLADGAQTLTVGLDKLAKGSVSLVSGLTALDTGATKAANGGTALASGLSDLATGTSSAADGASQVFDGASRLADGAQTLADSTAPLAAGVSQLNDGTASLKDAIASYTSGVDRASAGALLLQSKASDPKTGLSAGIAALSAGIGHANDTAGASASTTTLYGGVNSLADGANALAKGMTSPQPGSGVSLTEGAAQVAAGVEQIRTAVSGLDASKIQTAASGAQTLSTGVSGYTAAVDQLAAACAASGDTGQTCRALAALAAQSASLRAGSQSLATGLGDAATDMSGLAQSSGSLDALAAGAAQVSTGVDSAAQGAARLATGAAALQQSMPALRSGADALSAGVGAADSTDPATVMGAINALSNGLSTITAPAASKGTTVYMNSEKLRAGSAQVAAGAATMNSKVPALTSGVASLSRGATSLSEGSNALDSGMARLVSGSTAAAQAAQRLSEGLGSLASGAASADSGAQTLASGLATADSGSRTLSEGATALSEGVHALDDGAGALSEGATSLAEGLQSGAERIPSYTDSERDAIATIGSQVATVNAVRDHAVANNGAGFTPMFMSLALWVGAIALFLILPALDKRDHGEKWWASAVRPATTATLLAVAQAVIMMVVVDASAGIEAKNLPGLCLMAMAASITFMLINQACVASLAFRGRFISIILLSLQITSMGATFPVETAPAFFQWIHPFLPMSYTQLAFRDLIAGSGAQGAIGNALAVLGIWAALALVVILIGARIRRGPKPLPADNALAPTAA